MVEESYRIRQKGKGKWVIQMKPMNSNKWKTRTLLPLNRTWERVCPDIKKNNVSNPVDEMLDDIGQKGAQSLLTEPDEDDILRTLEEISK